MYKKRPPTLAKIPIIHQSQVPRVTFKIKQFTQKFFFLKSAYQFHHSLNRSEGGILQRCERWKWNRDNNFHVALTGRKRTSENGKHDGLLGLPHHLPTHHQLQRCRQIYLWAQVSLTLWVLVETFLPWPFHLFWKFLIPYINFHSIWNT